MVVLNHVAAQTDSCIEVINICCSQTTIMAVEYAEGVVVGADSRTSSGTFVTNRVTDKLTKVTDNIYCCRSGSAADTQAIADVVTSHMEILE